MITRASWCDTQGGALNYTAAGAVSGCYDKASYRLDFTTANRPGDDFA